MDTNLVLEGFKFMVLGMGTVFVFLVLMIFATNLMSSIILKYFPEPDSNAGNNNTGSTTSNTSKNSAKVAGITAAVMQHRQKN